MTIMKKYYMHAGTFKKKMFPKLKFAYINWTTYNTPRQKSTNYSRSVTILFITDDLKTEKKKLVKK